MSFRICLLCSRWLLYYLVSDLMNGGVPGGKIPFYVAGCVVCIGLILLTTFFQYNATYFATYKESGIRRITLAEHLRKIPLSFFGKKDLADLTSTIMADCTFLEQSFSHFIPELAGSIISTILISIGLLFTDWRMALAALWVLPVAFAIVGFSAKIQENITVGGMDVSRIDPETLLSLYSIVFQDVTLFDNTILENIRIGNKDATDEQVIAAAKLANVDEFAEKLPDGWHTNIGENGCELSGGERQRISIARAFLKNAPIILLDEATASLDVENETLIQTALSRLIADKTVLVIAHRMRTVAGADKIVVLSDGTVAEEGSPKDLEEKNGVYAHMVKHDYFRRTSYLVYCEYCCVVFGIY